jgi:hypothetical protein
MLGIFTARQEWQTTIKGIKKNTFVRELRVLIFKAFDGAKVGKNLSL